MLPPLGQPPMPPGAPMGGQPGMMPPPMPPAMMAAMSGMLSSLAQPERKTPQDDVRDAIEILKRVREKDPKEGRIMSAAIHVLRNGTDDLDAFMDSRDKGPRL